MTSRQIKVRKDIYKVTTFTLLVVFAINLIHHQLQAKAAFVSPASDLAVIEREVEKLVEVPRLPQSIEEEIRAVFGKDASLMIKVARCESGLKPGAKNKESTATGVFQIMASVHGVRRDWLTNEHINIQIAKALFDASGTNPWNASKSCWGSK
jgi:hypothetical protein